MGRQKYPQAASSEIWSILTELTPEEEKAYRQKVRAELEKKNDEKVKAKIKKQEETKAQGGPTVVAVKKLWELVTGK